MASKVSRAALVAGLVVGASGLVAVPAMAANNFVTLPAVTGVANVTPSSATLTGAVDTGGDQGTIFSAPATPGSNLSINAGDILNGIPVGEGYVSNVLFEADPMSDYTAAGNQPGGKTTLAGNIEVPTTTGLSSVKATIGAYPVAKATVTTPLKAGTKYVYFIVQQVGASDEATTINEYSSTDLANWIAGSGTLTGNGFAATTTVTNTGSKANSYSAWLAGTGSFANSNGTADPGDPTKIPGTVVNPDNQCVLNTTIAANPNGAALLAKGSLVPTVPGPNTHVVDGTGTAQNLQFGISSGGVGGALTPTPKQQPGSQGACISFFGGNSTNFYMSPVGKFTTAKLGTVVFGEKASVSSGKAAVSVNVKSNYKAAGTLELTTKKDKKTTTIASGKISAPANTKTTVGVKLTSAGTKALKSAKGGLSTTVKFTSTTDQPTSGNKIKLTSK